jgi:hypothetical protein
VVEGVPCEGGGIIFILYIPGNELISAVPTFIIFDDL